ncbi:hypothetical protein [Ruminococcus sp.]|uniref:hypothetical protein n=1 Tax=Ruminococcus sp. TaxID=41978 RepID=UPI001B02EBD8|nr:hypothetical protein [Ruminococcus sp.]MBO5557778.1 hypothetical protein [Ruminococcus sp.]
MTKQNNMTADELYCYDCIHNEVCRYYPHNGCDFKETQKEAPKSDTERPEAYSFLYKRFTERR